MRDGKGQRLVSQNRPNQFERLLTQENTDRAIIDDDMK
jgi:hypothetical protein